MGELAYAIGGAGAFFVVFGALLLCWLLVRTSQEDSNNCISVSVPMAQRRLEVVWLDEVLTMSTIVAALSGQPRWVERYNRHVGKLDEALAALDALLPESISQATAQKTSAANDRLIEIETLVHEAVLANDTAAAQVLIFGDEYWGQKAEYAEGYHLTEDYIQNEIASLKESNAQTTIGGSIALGAGAVTLCACTAAAVLLWRYSRRQAQDVAMAQQCAEAIADMQLDEQLSFLQSISKPSRVQAAFVRIIMALQQYKSYLPAALFAMQGDSDSEGDSPQSGGSGCDAEAGARQAQAPRKPSGSVAGSALSSGRSSRTHGDKGKPRAVPCGVDATLSRKVVAVLWAGSAGTHENLRTMTSQVTASAFHAMLGAMLQAVEIGRGVLDHISGDRAMVSFGAMRTGSDRLLSVRCALGIAEGVKGVGGRPHVGAERGKAYVGTIGTSATRKHTLMGTVVNTAYACSRVARQHSIPVVAGQHLTSETETEVQYWALCSVRGAKLGGAARSLVLSEVQSVRNQQEADEWLYQMADAADTDVHAEWNKKMLEAAIRADQAIRSEEAAAGDVQGKPDREGLMRTLNADGPVCSVPVDVAF